MNRPNTIWPEKYRSTTLDELILPERLINYFKTALENPMQFPNMLFYSPGAGANKTSTAEVLAIALKEQYKSQWKKINSSQDGNRETIEKEIIEWGSFNGYSKAPKIVILDEIDKIKNTSTFLDPLLGSIDTLNKSVRFIMTANNLINFTEYADSRVERIDFVFTDPSEIREMKIKMYNRLVYICEAEKVEYDKTTLQLLVKTFFPDIRKLMVQLYSCYLRNGSITGSDFNNTRSFDKYARLQETLRSGDFVATRNLYNTMPPENDIFTALMTDFVTKIEHPVKQMEIVCAIRKHMIPHNTVIDKEINIASMFAEIILILNA